MTPEIIAHRGASYLAPENTLSAFRKAMEIGADGVEMDVQQTSDKKLVIHHDYIIDLHTDISGKIYDMTEGELKELDFGSWKDSAYKDEKIATLEEALALCKELDVARVQLEMKAPLLHSDAFVEQVVEQVRAAGLGEKLVLTSFNHDHLKLAKQQMPELQVGALLFGAVETLALPKGTWETLGLQNGLDEDEDEDDFPQLPVPTVENMDEENCRELTRWVNDKYSMLQAAFPNESLSGILSKLNRQRDPALGYARDVVPMLLRLWPLMAERGVRYLQLAQGKDMRNPKVISARELYQQVARKYGIEVVPITGVRSGEAGS